MLIDALQYIRPSRAAFQQMRKGNLSAVHITVGYHEDFCGVVENLKIWNNWFASCEDLIARATTWNEVLATNKANKTAILFGLQNPLPIGADIRQVETLVQLGIRFCQITYNQQSLLGAGCFEPFDSGLTAFGREVVDEMNRVGMVIDMSHSAERSTLEAIDYSHQPVIVSHANPSHFHPALRNKSNKVIDAVAANAGLLGFSLYPFHLKNGPQCTLDDFCDMVVWTAERMGVDKIGLGSDLCQNQPQSVLEWMRNGRWSKTMDYGEGSAGNAGWPDQLSWFGDSRDFPGIASALSQRGFSDDEMGKIMGGNWLDLLTRAGTSTALQSASHDVP